MSGIWKDEVENGVVIISKLTLNDICLVVHSYYRGKINNYYTVNCGIIDGGFLIKDYILDCDFDIVDAKEEAIELLKSLSTKIINGLSLLEIEE